MDLEGQLARLVQLGLLVQVENLVQVVQQDRMDLLEQGEMQEPQEQLAYQEIKETLD